VRRGGWLLIAGVGVAAVALLGVSSMSDYMTGPKWDRLLPEMKHKVLQLLAQAKAAGLNVMFYDGWRSPAREAQYQKQGTSALHDPYNNYHTWGAAADIVFSTPSGQPYWPKDTDPRWHQLGAIGKRLGLFWGGDWPHLQDMAHFQLKNVSVHDLRRTYGTDFLAWLRDNGAIA